MSPTSSSPGENAKLTALHILLSALSDFAGWFAVRWAVGVIAGLSGAFLAVGLFGAAILNVWWTWALFLILCPASVGGIVVMVVRDELDL